jgi:hypothetical protein
MFVNLLNIIIDENKFEFYSIDNLIFLWNKNPMNNIERFFVYKELQKRNKLYLLDIKSKHKINNDEYICAQFKQGFSGGFSSEGGTLIYLMLVIFIPITIFQSLDNTYFYGMQLKVRYADRFYSNIIFFCDALVILMLLDMLITSYIIITNKSIIAYKCIFRLIKLPFKFFPFNNISLVNDINIITFHKLYAVLKKNHHMI